MQLKILLVLTTLISLPLYSAVDPNIPKPGEYKWTLVSDSNNKTIPEQCIKYDQSGINVPGFSDCKTGPAVKGANSTKMSAECAGNNITVELKFISENNFQQILHIEEKKEQDSAEPSTDKNNKHMQREAQIQKMYEEEKDPTKKARLKASLGMMKAAHAPNAVIKTHNIVYNLTRIGDCK